MRTTNKEHWFVVLFTNKKNSGPFSTCIKAENREAALRELAPYFTPLGIAPIESFFGVREIRYEISSYQGTVALP